MKIVHRVGHRLNESQRGLLESLGVTLNVVANPWGDPLVAFDLVESEMPEVHALVRQWGMSKTATWTEFTKQEVAAARWCSLTETWQHGYPQPDQLNFGHRHATYDLSDHCSECGTGMRQRAPFQMKSEPKWGRREVLQLHWVIDEFFTTPDLWKRVFEPRGVACRAVIDTKGGELKTVVQLVVDGEQVHVATAGLVAASCVSCGRKKYEHPTRGFFPPLATMPSRPIVKTAEWFGNGAEAGKRVLVSQELVRTMTDIGLRGTSFCPSSGDSTAMP